REVDHAAAELAGEVGRVGLLHEAGGDHIGGKDVERHHTAERLRARQGKAVEERERVAVTKAADVDEALTLYRKASYAAERTGDVAFARTRDLLACEDRYNLRRTAGHVLPAATGDDDLAAAARDGDLRFLLGACGILLVLRIGGCALRAGFGHGNGSLRERGARKRESCGEQEQPRQLLAG